VYNPLMLRLFLQDCMLRIFFVAPKEGMTTATTFSSSWDHGDTLSALMP